MRRAMDEHLGAWSIVWAELETEKLLGIGHAVESLGTIPPHPLVEMDFSFVVGRSERYSDVSAKLVSFSHELLKRISYVGSYEGKSVEVGKRSLTFRTVLGSDDRTLVESEVSSFRSSFEDYLISCGFGTRR